LEEQRIMDAISNVSTAHEAHSQPQLRVCPNCGADFPAGGRGLGKRFCSSTCRTSYANRQKAEGAVMASLVKCWLANRHAKPGSREAELCRRARAELTEIGRMFIEADMEAGRPPVVDYVEALFSDGTFYVDRTRKF
jgi:hypothetical protein